MPGYPKIFKKLIELTNCKKITWYHPEYNVSNEFDIVSSYKKDYNVYLMSSLMSMQQRLNPTVSLTRGWLYYTLKVESRVIQEYRWAKGDVHLLWESIKSIERDLRSKQLLAKAEMEQERINLIMSLPCPEKGEIGEK